MDAMVAAEGLSVIFSRVSEFLFEDELYRLLLTERRNLEVTADVTTVSPSVFLTRDFWHQRFLLLYNSPSIAAQLPSANSLNFSELDGNHVFWKAVCLTAFFETESASPYVQLPSRVEENVNAPVAVYNSAVHAARSLQRAVKLLPFASRLPAPFNSTLVTSFYDVYVLNRDGASLRQLENSLAPCRRSSNSRFGVCPSLLLIQCWSPTDGSDQRTVGVFIDRPWPFPTVSTFPDEVVPSSSTVRLFSCKHGIEPVSDLNTAPHHSQEPRDVAAMETWELTEDSTELQDRHVFGINLAHGFWFGGSYGSAALSVDCMLQTVSSWPSKEFGLSHTLFGKQETAHQLSILSIEVWAPYWATQPEFLHPRYVAQRRRRSAHQSSLLELPKCLRHFKVSVNIAEAEDSSAGSSSPGASYQNHLIDEYGTRAQHSNPRLRDYQSLRELQEDNTRLRNAIMRKALGTCYDR